MLSLKYIRIRKERPAEQRLSTIWREACVDFGIPCILVYLEEDHAYISASLKHLPSSASEKQHALAIEEELLHIQFAYAGSAKGYWKHNDCYYTFDSIPRGAGKEAAAAIFEVLTGYPEQNLIREPAAFTVTAPVDAILLKPENKEAGTGSLNPVQEPPG